MNKVDFILELSNRLEFLPQEEAFERIEFYTEMIDDRMEKGLSEEEAVQEAGNIDDIVSQIISETPRIKLITEKMRKNKKFGVVTILLLVLGSPIWLSLLIAAGAVVFSVYIALWSVIVSLWAVAVSVVAVAVTAIGCGILFVIRGSIPAGIAMIGAGIACAGLSIFLCLGCKAIANGYTTLTKMSARWIKRRFTAKEAA